MIKYVALGQSNTISKTGFLSQLKMLGNARFLRAAMLGASPSVIGPYFLNDAFFVDADYCIVDTCVVDFSAHRSSELHQIINWVEWIGHKARINCCQPIFLLIPVQHLAFTDPPLMSAYRSIINDFGYLFLDVREVLCSIMESEDLLLGDLYDDGSHIGHAVSKMIAQIFAGFFERDGLSDYKPKNCICSPRPGGRVPGSLG